MSEHIVIFSHGFGVDKTDRGLFTDVLAGLKGATPVMFDYNETDPKTGSLIVAPLTEQAAKLNQVVVPARLEHPGAVVDLVCHSQGCVVAALLMPKGLRRVVFTAPPAELSVPDMQRLFAGRPGSTVDLSGTSVLARSDGGRTLVPKTYWDSIRHIDPIAWYADLAKTTELVVINARQDEIIGSRDFSRLDPAVKVVELDADHNFSGNARSELVRRVAGLLT
jgi:hypothetical protein